MAVGPTSYTIRNGDTLSALAQRFNTTVDALAKANNIKNVDQILTGGTLTIPGKRDDYASFNRPSLGSFTAAAGRKSGRFKDLAAKLRERESASRTSSMESMPVTLENSVSNKSDNLINANDPTLKKLANAKLGTGAEHSCVATTRNNMVRAGVIKPFTTGRDVGNNPRGAMVQLGQQGWKSVPFPGSTPTTIKSPYGTMQASVIPRDQYLKLMKEGKIPEGAVVFSTRHESWNGTSPGSRGYDMALSHKGGLYNYKQVGPSMYKDLKSVVVMVPASALNSGGNTTTGKTTPAPTPTTQARSPQEQVLDDAKEVVDDLRNGDVSELVKDLGRLLGNAGRIGLPAPVLQKQPPIVGGAEGKLEPTKPATATKGKSDLTGIKSNKGFDADKYDSIINEMAAKYGVPPRLLKAQMKQESQFDPNARSPKGAAGLIQLMPGTAKEMGVKNPYDPRQNIEGAAKYMSQMLKLTGGKIPEALAAYNAGPGNYQKYKGIPPFKETQTYVRNIMETYNRG